MKNDRKNEINNEISNLLYLKMKNQKRLKLASDLGKGSAVAGFLLYVVIGVPAMFLKNWDLVRISVFPILFGGISTGAFFGAYESIKKYNAKHDARIKALCEERDNIVEENLEDENLENEKLEEAKMEETVSTQK